MLKKTTILIIFLCLFLSINASATSYQYAGVYSENRAYSTAFGGDSWYMMQAAAVLNDYIYDPTNPVMVSIDDGSSVDDYALSYFGPQFLGSHLSLFAFPPFYTPPPPTAWGGPYPHPLEPIWSNSSYSFSVNDGDGNLVTSDWTITSTQQLAIPSIYSIDPINKILDWNDVAGADVYQFLIAPVDEFGTPILPEAFYSSGQLLDSEFNFGDIAALPGDYAIWIQALDTHPDHTGQVMNRSSYVFDYHVPEPVPEPTTMLLLGTGLLGLAGLSRKKLLNK